MRWLMLGLLFGSLVLGVVAQEENSSVNTDWEVIISYPEYTNTTNGIPDTYIARLTANGIGGRLNLSAAGVQRLFAISPDQHYGLTLIPEAEGVYEWVDYNQLALVDLLNCCTLYPLANTPDNNDYYPPGIFSPDSRYIAIPYSEKCTCNDYACCSILSEVVIIDVATHQEVQRTAIGQRSRLKDWTTEGLRFYSTMRYNSVNHTYAPLQVRRLDHTVNYSQLPTHFILRTESFGEALSTGEYIMPAPQRETVGGIERNELWYFPTTSITTAEPEHRRIYTEGGTNYTDVHWVLDGNAVFFHKGDRNYYTESYLLHRSGAVHVIQGIYFFLAGTPDGFLAFRSSSASDTTLYHMQFVNDTWVIHELDTIASSGIVWLLASVPLGGTIKGTFPEVPAQGYRG